MGNLRAGHHRDNARENDTNGSNSRRSDFASLSRSRAAVFETLLGVINGRVDFQLNAPEFVLVLVGKLNDVFVEGPQPVLVEPDVYNDPAFLHVPVTT
jgi:hypothetical protein